MIITLLLSRNYDVSVLSHAVIFYLPLSQQNEDLKNHQQTICSTYTVGVD
jgi:hypothetical protein